MKWWDVPWNPAICCTPVNECCRKCWAKLQYERIYKGKSFNQVQLCPHVMDKPLHRHIKTTYFVCNWGDIFHKDIPDDYIHECFAVMTLACWHNFFVLTKRIDRAVKLLNAPDAYERRKRAADVVRERTGIGGNVGISNPVDIPPKNIAVGTTVGLQKHADEFVPLLLQVPAWRHFLSYEPALGPIVFKNEWLTVKDKPFPGYTSRVDWIVAGGENDEDAEPCHLDWLRNTIRQCDEHNVAIMVKQIGTRPVDSICDEWPSESTELQPNGFGEYLVCGLKGRAGEYSEEWPKSLRRHETLIFGYPQITARAVTRANRNGDQLKLIG